MGSPLQVPQDLIGSSGLYNTPDPFLRRSVRVRLTLLSPPWLMRIQRLRLEDTTGHSITDVARYFRGKELLVLYAGSEHGAGE